MRVTIIGPGNMGRALTQRLLAGGHTVLLVGRDLAQAERVVSELRASVEEDAPLEAREAADGIANGDLVILALPYRTSIEVARRLSGELRGRTVVDVSNPLNETYDALLTEGGPSAAERIQAELPGASVVKAFNTIFSRTLPAGRVAGQPLDVFIAGDDDSAVASLTEVVRTSRMRAIPVGPLARSRELEALGFLGIRIQEPLGTSYSTGWKLLLPGSSPPPERKGFPTHAVVGVLDDPPSIGRAVAALGDAGIDERRIHVITGAEGRDLITHARSRFERALSALFGFENEHTDRHLQELDVGHALVVVEMEDGAEADRVGEILGEHGGHFINYYSRWTARRIAPSKRSERKRTDRVG